MQLQCNLITHQARRGTKDGKNWFIHTADCLIQTIDKDGNIGEAVVEVRLPESAPLTLERGPHVLDVQPYKAREGGLAFAVRSITPTKTSPKA